MSIYVAIDEAYSVQKISGVQQVVNFCSGYYTVDGQTITKSIVQRELKSGSFNIYEYDDDQLIEAREVGFVIGVDWHFKIQAI